MATLSALLTGWVILQTLCLALAQVVSADLGRLGPPDQPDLGVRCMVVGGLDDGRCGPLENNQGTMNVFLF